LNQIQESHLICYSSPNHWINADVAKMWGGLALHLSLCPRDLHVTVLVDNDMIRPRTPYIEWNDLVVGLPCRARDDAE
jgi:hypothetical protein